MNYLKKLANTSFHGYIVDTGKDDADLKRKKLKEQGFAKTERDNYLKERKGPLEYKYNQATEETDKIPGRFSILGGTLGGTAGLLGSLKTTKATGALNVLGGLAAGGVAGRLAGGSIANRRQEKIDDKKDFLNRKMDAVLDTKLLRQKGDPEFYIKTAAFKEASIASKLLRAFPNSKTLDKITTNQVVRAQQKGNTARRNTIRGDMDAAGATRKSKARGPETGLVRTEKPERGLVNTKKPNTGKGVGGSTSPFASNLNALKDRSRDMYMLAGGAALGAGGGYAVANSNSENK